MAKMNEFLGIKELERLHARSLRSKFEESGRIFDNLRKVCKAKHWMIETHEDGKKIKKVHVEIGGAVIPCKSVIFHDELQLYYKKAGVETWLKAKNVFGPSINYTQEPV